MISLQQRRDHVSRPPTQLRFARSHTRTKPTISRSRGSVPLRPPSPLPPLLPNLRSYENQRRTRNSILFAESLVSIHGNQEEYFQTGLREFMKACQGLQWTHTTRILLIVQNPTGSQTQTELSGIFSCTPEHHIAFCPIFVLPLFPVFELHVSNGSFCPSSPFDLPKCQTIITVRVCVKASLAEGLTFPNVKNDAGQSS